MAAKKRRKPNQAESRQEPRPRSKKRASSRQEKKLQFEEIERSSPTLFGIISSIVLGMLLGGFVSSYIEGILYSILLLTSGALCIYWFCWRGSHTVYFLTQDGRNFSYEYLAYFRLTPSHEFIADTKAIPRQKRRVLTKQERENLLTKPSSTYVSSEDYLNSIMGVIAGILVVVIIGIYVTAIEPQVSSLRENGPTQIVGKSCSFCGKGVSMDSKAGDTCPHCGVKWAVEK